MVRAIQIGKPQRSNGFPMESVKRVVHPSCETGFPRAWRLLVNYTEKEIRQAEFVNAG